MLLELRRRRPPQDNVNQALRVTVSSQANDFKNKQKKIEVYFESSSFSRWCNRKSRRRRCGKHSGDVLGLLLSNNGVFWCTSHRWWERGQRWSAGAGMLSALSASSAKVFPLRRRRRPRSSPCWRWTWHRPPSGTDTVSAETSPAEGGHTGTPPPWFFNREDVFLWEEGEQADYIISHGDVLI